MEKLLLANWNCKMKSFSQKGRYSIITKIFVMKICEIISWRYPAICNTSQLTPLVLPHCSTTQQQLSRAPDDHYSILHFCENNLELTWVRLRYLPFSVTYFTQNILQAHPCCCKWQDMRALKNVHEKCNYKISVQNDFEIQAYDVSLKSSRETYEKTRIS